jgi:hypothetical protein
MTHVRRIARCMLCVDREPAVSAKDNQNDEYRNLNKVD